MRIGGWEDDDNEDNEGAVDDDDDDDDEGPPENWIMMKLKKGPLMIMKRQMMMRMKMIGGALQVMIYFSFHLDERPMQHLNQHQYKGPLFLCMQYRHQPS